MSKYSHFEMCEKIFGQKYKWNEQKHDYEPYSRTDMWNKMIEQQDKISDLEAKLAESEKKNFELVAKINLKEHKPAFCTLADRDCEALWQVEELQKQLSEKDKEYQSFKKIADENVNYLKNRILEETRNYNQDKISFAVEQLQWLKEKVDNAKIHKINMINTHELYEILDNKIKQLKEKNNG